MSDHFTKLENMYHKHNLNEFYEARITISRGQAEVIFPLSDKLHHAADAVHGAVYFKALDDAGFFAANSIVEDYFVLTANFIIYFFKPVVTGSIIGVGKLVYNTNSQFIAETILYDEKGNEIARGTGTYVKSKIKLDVLSYSKLS